MELTALNRAVVAGAFGLVATLATQSPAQQVPGPATSCAEGVGAPYRRCALWLDGRRVRRGAEGAVVAEPGFFMSPRLTGIVEGDSAMAQARAFERNSNRSIVFGVLSGLMFVGAWSVAEAFDCRPDPTFGFCTTTDDNYGLAAAGLLVGGIVSGIASTVLQQRANRAAARAIFWHNSNFAR